MTPQFGAGPPPRWTATTSWRLYARHRSEPVDLLAGSVPGSSANRSVVLVFGATIPSGSLPGLAGKVIGAQSASAAAYTIGVYAPNRINGSQIQGWANLSRDCSGTYGCFNYIKIERRRAWGIEYVAAGRPSPRLEQHHGQPARRLLRLPHHGGLLQRCCGRLRRGREPRPSRLQQQRHEDLPVPLHLVLRLRRGTAASSRGCQGRLGGLRAHRGFLPWLGTPVDRTHEVADSSPAKEIRLSPTGLSIASPTGDFHGRRQRHCTCRCPLVKTSTRWCRVDRACLSRGGASFAWSASL